MRQSVAALLNYSHACRSQALDNSRRKQRTVTMGNFILKSALWLC
jgi:hypothetical protein